MSIQDAPINRYAAGLLGLADIKAMGKPPSRMLDSITGVIDIDPFWRAESRIILGGGAAAVNLIGNYTAGLQVPAGKAWIVESVAMHTSLLPNGGVLRVCPSIMRITTNSYVWIGPNSQTFFATATRVEGGPMTSHTFSKPFMMLPGMQWAFDVTTAEALGAGVAISLFATVNVVDL